MSAGGKISPCCAVPGEWNDFGAFVPGQVSFADVWNGEEFRRSRSDFAGAPYEHLQATVCTRCPVPKFVHHMYSLHDYKVIGQAAKVLESDPVLTKAFDLLSRSRYGAGMQELFPSGSERPEHFFGTEEASHIANFVEFYRDHLACANSFARQIGIPAAAGGR